jgi:hypothetical protein
VLSKRAGEELRSSACSLTDCLGLLRNGREKNGFNLRSKRLLCAFFLFQRFL